MPGNCAALVQPRRPHPDQRRGESCQITVWNPRTGAATETLSGHTWDVSGLVRTLASGSRDTSVRLWRTDFDAPDLDQRLCAVMTRNLTREEWRRYLPGEDYEPTCHP